MKKKLIIVQAVLCVTMALMLVISALMIYSNGILAREADPAVDIYTVQVISSAVRLIVPVFAVSVLITIICVITGAKDEVFDLPVKIMAPKNLSDMARQSNSIKTIRIVVFVLAVIFIIAGILNGSMNDVFIKASKICTECIGLG